MQYLQRVKSVNGIKAAATNVGAWQVSKHCPVFVNSPSEVPMGLAHGRVYLLVRFQGKDITIALDNKVLDISGASVELFVFFSHDIGFGVEICGGKF